MSSAAATWTAIRALSAARWIWALTNIKHRLHIISYAWLQQYGLPTKANADYTDPDGTGMNVYQDWIAGLNPTNALSVLQMTSATATNNPAGLVVTWQSVSGIMYFLQSSTNLAAQPAFITIQSNIAGQAGTTSYTDTSRQERRPVLLSRGRWQLRRRDEPGLVRHWQRGACGFNQGLAGIRVFSRFPIDNLSLYANLHRVRARDVTEARMEDGEWRMDEAANEYEDGGWKMEKRHFGQTNRYISQHWRLSAESRYRRGEKSRIKSAQHLNYGFFCAFWRKIVPNAFA